ncbi:MAG TPA: M23 family metallopeptidase [Gammaproteobacteria bacterium]|nr:M23 family metallopeptidase [Gammaproteobacteria bacterium]
MNIILFTRTGGRTGSLNLSRPRVYVPFLLMFALLCGGLVFGGYQLALMQASQGVVDGRLQAQVAAQHEVIQQARRAAQDHLDALALRLGKMQAQMLRLDALGQQLTKMADVDQGEFNFNEPPAQGGPEDPADLQPTKVPDFVHALDQLSRQIGSRQQQLGLLQTLLMNRNLHKQVKPAGRPVHHGWISSYFGMRTDPFNGKREFHPGIDFAGKKGSAVVAVAAGVVTWAGPRSGYGNLVEINHGNGLTTRYGHNEKVLVKVGQKVRQGQKIALMGSTGRSTGPHCHFEVRRNGKPINPIKYVRASR